MALFERMRVAGCLPNSYVYTALIRTLGKARQWRQGLAIYEVSLRERKTFVSACAAP